MTKLEKSAHLYAVNFFAKNFCILNGSAHLYAVNFFAKNFCILNGSAHLYAVNFFAKNFCILNGSADLHAVIFFHKNTALLDGFPAGAFVCKKLQTLYVIREKRNKKNRPLLHQQGEVLHS